jgi:hypothetical protein
MNEDKRKAKLAKESRQNKNSEAVDKTINPYVFQGRSRGTSRQQAVDNVEPWPFRR